MRCPYCHDALDPPERFCGACRTVLHAECWDLHGRCPTLGCVGGLRPRAPKTGRTWLALAAAGFVVVAGLLHLDAVDDDDVILVNGGGGGWRDAPAYRPAEDEAPAARARELLAHARDLRSQARAHAADWRRARAAGDAAQAERSAGDAARSTRHAMELARVVEGRRCGVDAAELLAELAALIVELDAVEWDRVRGATPSSVTEGRLGPIDLLADPLLPGMGLVPGSSLEEVRSILGPGDWRSLGITAVCPAGGLARVELHFGAFHGRAWGLLDRGATRADVLRLFGPPNQEAGAGPPPWSLAYVRGPVRVELRFHPRQATLVEVVVARDP